MTFQQAASPIMERVVSFHHLLLWVISIITLMVLVLLIYTCIRFHESRNPVPSKRTHNTILEIVWTGVPVLVLVIIAVPSFKLLYFADVMPKADLTIKAIGHQWYWSYEYPDNGNFTFDALLVDDDSLKPGQKRLLETDNRIVLPVGENIIVQVTATDVIHSWAMPPMGVKVDAVPGRLNQVWLNIERPGTYYGQCSELCGVNHAYMPITIEAVSKEDFAKWVDEAKTQFARADGEFDVAAGKAAAPATIRAN
jgi:cytochrome c oxidase subunit 2